jgi:hypothetical protein
MVSTRSSVRSAEYVTADVKPSLLLNYTSCIKQKAVLSVSHVTTEAYVRNTAESFWYICLLGLLASVTGGS